MLGGGWRVYGVVGVGSVKSGVVGVSAVEMRLSGSAYECGGVGVWGCWSVGVLECGGVGVWACWSVGVLECGRTVNCAQGLFVRERKRLFIARSLLDGLIRLCSCPPAPIAHTRRLRRCLCVCVCVSVCLCVGSVSVCLATYERPY